MNKKNNILGITVTATRPDKAVNQTMDYLKKKGMQSIFFLTSGSSLYCQSHTSVAELVNACDWVFPGDNQMELAASDNTLSAGESAGICKFAKDYMDKLFNKLNKEHSYIFVVVEQEDILDSLKQFVAERNPDLILSGYVYDSDGNDHISPDIIVNEINAVIPDVVLLALSPEAQFEFLKEYKTMMNTKVLIFMENFSFMLREETSVVPEWVHGFHLDGLYHWFKKEQKLQQTILNSIFFNRIRADEDHQHDNELPEESSEDFKSDLK